MTSYVNEHDLNKVYFSLHVSKMMLNMDMRTSKLFGVVSNIMFTWLFMITNFENIKLVKLLSYVKEHYWL